MLTRSREITLQRGRAVRGSRRKRQDRDKIVAYATGKPPITPGIERTVAAGPFRPLRSRHAPVIAALGTRFSAIVHAWNPLGSRSLARVSPAFSPYLSCSCYLSSHDPAACRKRASLPAPDLARASAAVPETSERADPRRLDPLMVPRTATVFMTLRE
jgi:hypothetical protein